MGADVFKITLIIINYCCFQKKRVIIDGNRVSKQAIGAWNKTKRKSTVACQNCRSLVVQYIRARQNEDNASRCCLKLHLNEI